MSSAFSVNLPEDCGYEYDATSILWLKEHAYSDMELEVITNIHDTNTKENS